MSGKFALIIGNTEYTDPGLAQLTAPGKDVEDFARVLRDQEICAFDEVKVLLNESEPVAREAIDEFFDQKKPEDLLVLYFSGHGVRDELGSLYLAVKNTTRNRLRSTAIKSDYIREVMDQSRSKRQVLILDCCNSGAFPQGTKAELGGSMGITKAFQGYGRFILTASDATQFAWEGNQVIGKTDNSLFTHFLVQGLEGQADSDGDGRITVDELYDYAYDQISRITPKQTPTKFSTKQQGELVLRQNIRMEDIKPIPLSEDLIAATKSSLPYVREAAVRQLNDLLNGKNLALARSAVEALERISEEDDSRQIAQAAKQALQSVHKAKEEQIKRESFKALGLPRQSTTANVVIKQHDVSHKEDVSKQSVYSKSSLPSRLKESALSKIRALQLPDILRSIFQPTGREEEQSAIRRTLISIFWLFLFLIVLPIIFSLLNLHIQNVVLLFWGFVIVFGVIGIWRPWAKEALVSSSVVLGLALNHLLRKYIPLINNLAETDVSLFWLRTAIIVILTYIGYQAGIKISLLTSKGVRQRFQDNRFGMIVSAINGYLIVGTLLYYDHIADYYPLWDIISKPTDPRLLQVVNMMMLYMPPQLLGEPIIYFAVFLAFILVLIVLI